MEGQIVNVFNLTGYVTPVTTTQLSHCSSKMDVYNIESFNLQNYPISFYMKVGLEEEK